ncbi:cytochrome c oxidase accessory protein CcoG [Arcicella sp. LKC2W]|uniref:cytochrome c oxidase accessory protein CcoG n=1 Tax=Arcicella sp. LKC2W TaxID=2984198 RepID=UPI002B215A6B|nr:cytochrome c oxidase accessory protein CcoG [Arcicella sp. LKC2W]MEA5459028.1 cytochrome c oxidase accessory protein CcoG [Arcicella sp. LKC2W]
MKPAKIDTTNYRDHLSNVTQTGKRIWIYPRIVAGQFYKLRTYFSWLLLGLLLGLPWVEVDGHPIFLFNVLERRFIFFGVTFFPQDFHLVAIGLLTFIVFIILFTVIFGRVWCGWACPQTIFMEMLFRKVEILIEGDHNAQRRLDTQPWTTEKIWKKTLKHFIFVVLSFLIANVFLAYLIGKKALLAVIFDNPLNHLVGLFSIIIFTAVFYFVFARFRELVCIVVCPYGRLQGVMLDKKSIVVAYDFIRGEIRGKHQTATEKEVALAKNEPVHGSCIDCKICVQVCPTGIDIRNGTQLECIGCTACIDACDEVMDKIEEPRGLIRYASVEGIEQKKKLKFSGRIAAYSLVLVALLGILGFLLITRNMVETTILRAPGLTYQESKDGTVSNLYNVQVLNKSYQKIPVQFHLKGNNGQIKMIGKSLMVQSGEVAESSFFIILPTKSLKESSVKLEIEVISEGKIIDVVKTKFLGPIQD